MVSHVTEGQAARTAYYQSIGRWRSDTAFHFRGSWLEQYLSQRIADPRLARTQCCKSGKQGRQLTGLARVNLYCQHHRLVRK